MLQEFFIYVVILLTVLYYLGCIDQYKIKNESFTPNITNESNTSYLYPKPYNGQIDKSQRKKKRDESIDEPSNTINNYNEDTDDKSEENQKNKKKFITIDAAKPGKYKKINYKDGTRGTNEMTKELEDNFNSSNELIQDDYVENDKYNGYDESDGKYATYNGDKKKSDKYKLDEIFNSDNYMPNYKKDDWFEVLPEAISVKNRHLINVSKPIGINTIGTSLRNASWDLRGSMPCPKFVVAPWMQSTIEQDTNLKSLC